MNAESTDNGFHDEVKTETIRIFSSHTSADLAAANLEAHGIECWLNADDCGGMYPNLTVTGGVRLVVRASDAEAAMALLNVPASEITNQHNTQAAVSSSSNAAPENKNWFVPITIVIGILVLLYLLDQWTDKAKNETETTYHHTNGKN
ncbi:MAG: hypothetical protein ACREFE_09745 [Limisphaerales bacterium]